jgi:hypothetical protein
VKERQDSIAARIAGTIAGGVRRRQQERAPRALVYDASGEPRVVAPGGEAHAALVAAAEAVVDAALDDADDGAAAREDEGAEAEAGGTEDDAAERDADA